VNGSRVPGWLSFWVPIVTSLVSLIISLGGIFIATRQPELLLVMPDQIRVAQGGQAPYTYLQPTFVGVGLNERAEVILDMTLQVSSLNGGTPVEFYWDEQGTWSYDAGSQELSWTYIADAAPLLVSRQTPQLPTGLFIGPPGWAFEEGRYRITLVVQRAINSRPLQRSIVVEFSQQEIETMNSSQGSRFLTIPVTTDR
jgi:hypothetical protein